MITVTISLPEEDAEYLRELSKKLISRENISHMVSYLINLHRDKTTDGGRKHE